MPTPQRSRISWPLIVIVLVAFLVLQRISYAFRLAAMELRYGGIVIILGALLVWSLMRRRS